VGLAACGGEDEKGEGRPLVCNDEQEDFEVPTYEHVQGRQDYEEKPPVGGDHNQCWTDWGVHEKAAAAENWVHNLEHGGIAFLYNCKDGCPKERKQLEALYDESTRPFALITPYADMESRFAVVAWGHRIVTDCYDEELFLRFYDEYAHKGPEGSPVPPLPRPPQCK